MSNTITSSIAVALLSILLFEIINAATNFDFVNWHWNDSVGGPFENLFQPQNTGQEQVRIQNVEYQSGLQALKNIVLTAQGKRIRAYGSRWSTTNVAYTEELLVETWGLNYCQVGIADGSHVTSAYSNIANRLVVTQAGVFIKDLNKALLDASLALPTSGSGDGQRIVGATSTGTHGSAFRFGSMQDFVRGIHIVLPGRSYFIQSSTQPVVTQAFVTQLDPQAVLLEDDDMFYAALVSFGSFGLIHAVVLEADPLYQLRCQNYPRSFRDIRSLINNLDVTTLDLDVGPSESIYHFVALVNPFRLEEDKGAVIQVCARIEPTGDASLVTEVSERYSMVNDFLYEQKSPWQLLTAGSVGSVISNDFLWGLGAKIRRRVFNRSIQGNVETALGPFDSPKTQFPSEWFTFEGSDEPFRPNRKNNINAEVSVPVGHGADMIEIISNFLYDQPIQTFLEVRFQKSTKATLGFTSFPDADMTTTIAISTPVYRDTIPILEDLFVVLRETGLPHHFHWGKYHPHSFPWAESYYGADLVKWQHQRGILLQTDEVQNMFSNRWMDLQRIYVTPRSG